MVYILTIQMESDILHPCKINVLFVCLWSSLHYLFFYFFFQRSSNIDNEIKVFTQPQIVFVGDDLEDVDLLHIVVEGAILCTISSEKITDAILGLLAAFYVFNIQYSCCKGVFAFLEETLLELPRGQTLLCVSNFINALI